MTGQGTESLTAPTLEVLRRVPSEWRAEELVKHEISKATATTMATVSQRLAHLREVHLVERRVAPRAPGFEVRRIAKAEEAGER